MIRTEYIIDDDFLDDETKMSAESQGYLWELIRCKDCKHWQKSSINYNEYVCYWGGYVKKEDDFCSWAKREE